MNDFAIDFNPSDWVTVASVDAPEEPRDPLIPVLPAEVLVNGTQVRVWCCSCNRFHIHGRPTPGSDDTRHRFAHCFTGNPQSPYVRTGYELREVGPVGKLYPVAAHRRRRRN